MMLYAHKARTDPPTLVDSSRSLGEHWNSNVVPRAFFLRKWEGHPSNFLREKAEVDCNRSIYFEGRGDILSNYFQGTIEPLIRLLGSKELQSTFNYNFFSYGQKVKQVNKYSELFWASKEQRKRFWDQGNMSLKHVR